MRVRQLLEMLQKCDPEARIMLTIADTRYHFIEEHLDEVYTGEDGTVYLSDRREQ